MKNRIISLLLLLFSTLPATAEYFRNLGLQNGLSQPSVLSIAQDGLGRMWFGTQEGINMYDGEQITYVKGEQMRMGKNFGSVIMYLSLFMISMAIFSS